MPDWLLDLFTRYGYAAVFVGVMLEGTGIPVPGETMLLAGAVLAHLGRLSLPWVIAASIGGALSGDNLGFFIGRRGGRALIDRHGPKIGLTSDRLAHFSRFFERHGPKAIFFARFITGLRVVCAMLAGASGLPWRTFAVYNAAGVVAWSVVIGLVGDLLGESWTTLEHWIGRSSGIAFGLVIVLIVIVAVRARRQKTS